VAPKQHILHGSEGIPNLVVPEFVAIPDRPITTVTRWFDQFFWANLEADPNLIGQNIPAGDTWVNLDPRQTTLGIMSIRRQLPKSRRNSSGWIDTHEISSFPRHTGPDLYPIIRIEDDRRREDEVGFHISIDDEEYVVDRRNQQPATEAIQTLMDQILADLAYTPTETATNVAA
jgi:hypothetical protein